MAETKVSKNEIEAQEAWISPTLTNGWVNFGGSYNTVQYMKDTMGFVWIKGVAKSGTMGQPLFTLPVGYRPAAGMYYATASNGGICIYDVWGDGRVIPQVGSNGSIGCDIKFKADG